MRGLNECELLFSYYLGDHTSSVDIKVNILYLYEYALVNIDGYRCIQYDALIRNTYLFIYLFAKPPLSRANIKKSDK